MDEWNMETEVDIDLGENVIVDVEQHNYVS